VLTGQEEPLLARKRRERIGLLFTGAVVALIIALGVLPWLRADVQNGVGAVPKTNEVLPGGHKVESLAAAATEVDHVAYAPSGSDSEPTEVWIDDSGSVVALYDTGLSVMTQRPEFADPTSYYDAVIEDADRSSVHLTKVNGVIALAVEPNTDGLKSNPGLIRLQLDDLSVVVSAPNTSVADLSQIASNLRAVEAAPGGKNS
jgi:hypothetical protein